MNRILKNRKTDLWVLVIAMAMIFGVSGNAFAQSGSFYLGASGGIERANIEHAKTVDSTNVPASYLQSGNIYSTSDSASKTGFSGGLLAGYRLTLDPSDTFYLGVEIDGQFHGGTVSGTLPGDGESEGRNQYGEAWPDEWSVERKKQLRRNVDVRRKPPVSDFAFGPGRRLLRSWRRAPPRRGVKG